MLAAVAALDRLREGNRRFAACEPSLEPRDEAARRRLVEGQAPFAVILGCSDARVPAELVFDQSVGDLFVIRVAGNIVEPSQIGSVEFACAKFGTRLVIVLGHSCCGAIEATLRAVMRPHEAQSDNVRSIVEFIRPSIELTLGASEDAADQDILEQAVRANVRRSAGRLRRASELIERLEREDGLVIVGAEYALETGLVDFFDGVPA